MKRIDRLEVAHLNTVNADNMRGLVRSSDYVDVDATTAPFIVQHGLTVSPGEVGSICIHQELLDFDPTDLSAGERIVYATLVDRESWSTKAVTLRAVKACAVRLWFTIRVKP